MSKGMLPPHAIEIEQAVLGQMLVESDSVDMAMELLLPDYFYRTSHQLIFEALRRLRSDRKPVDMLSVEELLRRNGELEEAGGPGYLSEMTRFATYNIEYNATIIREYAALREVIRQGSDWIRDSYESRDVFELMGDMEQGLNEIQGMSFVSEGDSVEALVDPVLEVIFANQERQGLRGITTGLRDLDRLMGGWQSPDFTIVAGRPGMGKTAFMLNLARAAVEVGAPVGIFSLEMSSEQLVQRMIAQISSVPADKLRKGIKTSPEESSALRDAALWLKRHSILLDDTPSLGIVELRARAKRWKRQHGAGLFIVDYLQLARGERSKNEGREQEVSQISRGLKALAKETKCPVIALSQLSRAVEQRGGSKRPQLADLRESGSIEQDADSVMFLYRPEYYGIKVDDDGNPTSNLCEVNVAKNRHGPTDRVRVHFDADTMRFRDLTMFDY